MTDKTPDTTGKKQAQRTTRGTFAKGCTGNATGRPKGARGKATIAAQALLEGEAEKLTRRAVELALDGDMQALRLCLERILPPAKESALPPLDLPRVTDTQNLPQLTAAILQAVASGQILPHQGQALASLVQVHAKSIEVAELEARIAKLEEVASE